MNIPYDILDNIIISYLDIDSIVNLVISSPDIYYMYRRNKHYEIIMINKIMNYFPCLSKLSINYKDIDNNGIKEIYMCLNKIYYHFKKHRNTFLSDILVYLCDYRLTKTCTFRFLISKCYFTDFNEFRKQYEYRILYNAIRSDDLLYLLMFSEDLHTITKYIYIDGMILLHAILYKITLKETKDILLLFNYLLFTHFFRTSEYVEDIITDITCEIIKCGDIKILNEIYKKQMFYKFKLNYQKIINTCIQQKNLEFLEIVHVKMCEQNQFLRERERDRSIQPLLITKDSVRCLMKKKAYVVLSRVIELYLKADINMNGYVNEIINNFDYNNNECLELLRYLNDKNKNRIANEMIYRKIN
jgi:hypothetical protein